MRGISHQAVLHGIEMNVIQMDAVVPIVADRMFPEPTLPNPALALADPACGALLAGWQALRERGLDRLPSRREIRIPRRQRPHAMHMLRQDHPGIDVEWSPRAPFPHRLAQGVNVADQEVAVPVQQIDREEIGAPRDTVTPIVGHCMVLE